MTAIDYDAFFKFAQQIDSRVEHSNQRATSGYTAQIPEIGYVVYEPNHGWSCQFGLSIGADWQNPITTVWCSSMSEAVEIFKFVIERY